MIGFILPKGAMGVNVRKIPSLNGAIVGAIRNAMLCEWHESIDGHRVGSWQKIDCEDGATGQNFVGWVHTDFVTFRESVIMNGRRFVDFELEGVPTIAIPAREHNTLVRILQSVVNYMQYNNLEHDNQKGTD